MVLIYTTCKNTEEAVAIGNLIVSRHLAACVNIWPIQSMYLDGEALQSRLEAALLIKTLESKLQDIEDLVTEHHTYSTPFVGAFDIRRVNRAYKEWMANTIQ